MRGGERCPKVFCELFPSADLCTQPQVPGLVAPVIERRHIVTSLTRRLPQGRAALPALPVARPPYDIEYIERWSVWLDLKIIAMTVVRVLVDRNAY